MNLVNAPKLLSMTKIWDKAPHNAMTELIRFKDHWYCVFREGELHVKGAHGTLRLLISADGVTWYPHVLFKVDGVDLRDPKLSITPTGQLMLLTGGSIRDTDGNYLSLHSRVAISEDGERWSTWREILPTHEWLWRITWYQGRAYGASYSRSDPSDRKKEWNIRLWESIDGFQWNFLTQWDIQGYPNETTLRFLRSGTMIALVRRDKRFDNSIWLGTSEAPYTNWRWIALDYHVGGPNFLVMPNDDFLIAGRMVLPSPYGELERTFIGPMDFNAIHRLLVLPSGGDCSYPGMVFFDNTVWMSYYSSHEGKAAIYLARIAL